MNGREKGYDNRKTVSRDGSAKLKQEKEEVFQRIMVKRKQI